MYLILSLFEAVFDVPDDIESVRDVGLVVGEDGPEEPLPLNVADLPVAMSGRVGDVDVADDPVTSRLGHRLAWI